MTVNTVTLNQLESHLWEAANILRGPVDAADFKTYVFPLLFFKRLSWTNKDRLSDALLRDLIEHFSRIALGNRVAQADLLGQSYEYLIKKFADATNKKAGEFYTPRSVVRLMVKMLDPREGESIYDPTCGTGGMLLEAVHHVQENHGDDRTLWGKLFAQEKNLTTSAIARMNLFLHGAADFQVVRGDTLRSPAFFSGDNLATFDCVIANPPFSLEKWGDEVWTSDPYGRNFAGMPPAKSGDYAWVQHMIRTGLAACILVFRQRKAPDRKNQVLILDASKQFKTGRAQNELLPEHVERIHGWYHDYQDMEGVARVVTLEEITANEYNLNISRYVEPKVEQDILTVEEALQRLQASATAAFAAEDKLMVLLKREGLLQ